MKVTLKEWNAVATWHWDMPEDEVCGICRVQFDGTCPTCKFPGDDCALLVGKCGHSFHMILRKDYARCAVKSALIDPLARPSTSSRPSDQSVRTSDDHPIDEAPQHASPITSPIDDDTANDPGHQASETNEDGAGLHQPFQPFFTLIEDAHTSDHHHPTVHYIFSDDDTDIVTEAALRSLEAQQDALSGSRKVEGQGRALNPSHNPPEHHHQDNDKSALLPPPIPGVREHYIVLDVEPVQPTPAGPTPIDPSPAARAFTAGAGGTKSISTSPANPPTLAAQHLSPGPSVTQPQYRVTSAKSFSPTWQVLSSEIVPAPTFENGDPSDAPGRGLMLKIYGTAGIPLEAGKDKGERGTPRLEDMMDQFAKRMRELQMVIDAANVAPIEEGGQIEEGRDLLEEKTATEAQPTGNGVGKEGDIA
ncbi:Anaphase-promoting complex subunit 11 [Penicillium rolfsii]|nr:Anaphase-promoting complex subunit 11 [Penicillium rolfsii]